MSDRTFSAKSLDPEWPFDLFAKEFSVDIKTSALIVIDMQSTEVYKDPNSLLAQQYPDLVQTWEKQIQAKVIPNIQKLIQHVSQAGGHIVYTRNGNRTSTGKEMSPRLRQAWRNSAPANNSQSQAYDIIDELSPRSEDLVVDKLTSSPFTASFLDHALRNMGIQTVLCVGILTDACVFGAARTAAELSYQSVIVEDACATYTRTAHENALLMHARIFGQIKSTQDILDIDKED
ncbi:MAG: cysteine hydrolase [Lentisphaeria bacterium]|nr:cysteine hydrolase [Lentisphaeria bacterium]NQZ69892.1 cysteine hydrolase [Lentisphaeria bacterium]